MIQFDGRPGILPISAYYKGTFSLQFAFTSGGDPYILSGATASFSIYEKNGTLALALTSGSGLTVNGAAGTIDLSISSAQIIALATQEYNYEFIVTLAGGQVWPVLDSEFTISESGQSSYSGDTINVALDGNTVTLSVTPTPAAHRSAGMLISGTAIDATTGDSKAYIRIPPEISGLSLSSVAASCSTAGTAGTTSVQLRRVRAGVGVDMLSTKVQIEANETDSTTAASQPVIDTAGVLTADQIHFDIDAVSSGTRGIFISFTFDNV